MFHTYNLRPDTTQALRVTADDYQQVADWIADNIADDRGVAIVPPGTKGPGRPRITFHARNAPKYSSRTSLPIPGVLSVHSNPDGDIYTAHAPDWFDDVWQPADDA
ncbi:hypothetical protein ACFXKD_27685 [Nocardiopsis aegyptia]|uniref:hypothetical protein n=1 Tax=Nocardiopsis aegyptia TaxID=220378 RepID=UPI003672F640